MRVLELRQYTLLPEKRGDLIALFDSHLTEAQERCGMEVIGTFRDLSNPARFVWVRAFPDMGRRERSLREFYAGPVWRRYRDAANSTMVDSDNVLLLRPAWSGSAFPAKQPSTTHERGLVQAGVIGLRAPAVEDDIAFFGEHIAPLIEASGGEVLACLVTEQTKNNFPSLPVREGENVFVWFAGFLDAREGLVAEVGEKVSQAAQSWPARTGEDELLVLEPTSESRLNGNPQTASAGHRV